MPFIIRLLSLNLLALLLLGSSYGHSISANHLPTNAASAKTVRYVIGELVERLPQKIVTNVGTYSTSYIRVLDQRTPATILAAKNKTTPQGKVQLKLDSANNLLEVILY